MSLLKPIVQRRLHQYLLQFWSWASKEAAGLANSAILTSEKVIVCQTGQNFFNNFIQTRQHFSRDTQTLVCTSQQLEDVLFFKNTTTNTNFIYLKFFCQFVSLAI